MGKAGPNTPANIIRPRFQGQTNPRPPVPVCQKRAHCQQAKLSDGSDRVDRTTRYPRRRVRPPRTPGLRAEETRPPNAKRPAICNVPSPAQQEREGTPRLPMGGTSFGAGSGVIKRCAHRPAVSQVPNGCLPWHRLTPAADRSLPVMTHRSGPDEELVRRGHRERRERGPAKVEALIVAHLPRLGARAHVSGSLQLSPSCKGGGST